MDDPLEFASERTRFQAAHSQACVEATMVRLFAQDVYMYLCGDADYLQALECARLAACHVDDLVALLESIADGIESRRSEPF